jgi:protein SCO1/2
MQINQKTHEGLTWAALFAVAIAIAVAYVRERAGTGPKLPVLWTVPAFGLTNQIGRPFGLEDLKGRVWLANTLFTTCPSLCPKLARHFSELQMEFASEPDFRLLSLTADAERDTPELLKKFGDKYGADHNRWIFLTGRKADVQELGVNGMKFLMTDNPSTNRLDPNDLFLHGPYFLLVDRAGKVRGVYDGSLPEKREALREGIRSLLKER